MRRIIILILLLTFLCSCSNQSGNNPTEQIMTAIEMNGSQTEYNFYYPDEETDAPTYTEATALTEFITEIHTSETTTKKHTVNHTVKHTVKQSVTVTAKPTVTQTVKATTKPVTDKFTVTNPVTVSSTVANTTSAITKSTTRSTTKAPQKTTAVSVAPSTTAKPTTTVPVTTVPVTTVPTTTQAAKKWDIIISGAKIEFGCTPSLLVSAMGQPTEIINEQSTAGKQYSSYVYASDYSEMSVFQFCNDILGGFYTVNSSAIITDSTNTYGILSGGQTSYDNLYITQYTDSIGTGKVYAIHAFYDNFSYSTSLFSEFSGQEKLIFHTTNAMRALNGLAPFGYCEKAAKSARLHSEDMVANNYFNHTSLDGRSSSDRIRAQGVSCFATGENIAYGYRTPFHFADGWYNSSGHRSNILYNNFRYIGVGISLKSGSTAYGTQNFYG